MCAQRRGAVGCALFLFRLGVNMTNEELLHGLIVALVLTVIAYLERLRRRWNASTKTRRHNPRDSE